MNEIISLKFVRLAFEIRKWNF